MAWAQQPHPKLAGVTSLVFEGGGVRGFAYLAVLEYLGQTGVMSQCSRFAGASAGAVTAALLALGGTPDLVREVSESTPWRRFADDAWWSAPARGARLLSTGGLHSLSYPRQWIEERVCQLGWKVPACTFGSLFKATGRRLYLTATDEEMECGVVFGPEKTPDVLVSEALLASMAIPLFYPPVYIGGHAFSDGGLTYNFPIDLFADAPPVTVLGARVDSSAEVSGLPQKLSGFVDRAKRIISIATEVASRSHVALPLWERTIRIDCGDISPTAFDLTPYQRLWLVHRGFEALNRWLKE